MSIFSVPGCTILIFTWSGNLLCKKKGSAIAAHERRLLKMAMKAQRDEGISRMFENAPEDEGEKAHARAYG
jgi:hypothetical protein